MSSSCLKYVMIRVEADSSATRRLTAPSFGLFICSTTVY
jgi:hypothetical protein